MQRAHRFWVILLLVVGMSVLVVGAASVAQEFAGGVGSGGGGIGGSGRGGSLSAGSGYGFTWACLRMFDAGKDGRWLDAVEVVKGTGQGGSGSGRGLFAVFIIDGNSRVLRKASLPEQLWFGSQDRQPLKLPLPSIQVPRQYGIVVAGPGGGQLDVEASATPASFRWNFGDPPVALAGNDWKISPVVADQPSQDPKASDLVVLFSGEAFFDRLVEASGDDLKLTFAQRGELPGTAIALLELNAAVTPVEALLAVVHTAGGVVQGRLVSADERAIVVQPSGQQQAIPRGAVRRVTFQRVLIDPQVTPWAGVPAGGGY